MGQAKKRGTYEQRRADAIQREAEERKRCDMEFARRREAERAYEAANPRITGAGRSRSRMTSVLLSAAVIGAMAAATKE